jgi:glyoxylase-like metal-dependent hydrolase (beta-lactamase superfamily II)
MKLEKKTDSIYVFRPSNENPSAPNIGIILTKNVTILIDAGNSPKQAENVKYELNKINAPEIRNIILTHYHWDHTFGLCNYKKANIIGNKNCLENMKGLKEIPWSEEYIDNDIKENPEMRKSHESKKQVIKNWHDFEIKLPNKIYENEKVLRIDNKKIYIYRLYGKHSNDSTIIIDEKEKIAFIGDCFYPPPIITSKGDKSFDKEVLRKLLNYDVEVYIHGHGRDLKKDDLRRIMDIGEEKGEI